MRGTGADRLVVAVKADNAGGAKGAGCPRWCAHVALRVEPWGGPKAKEKPFDISKRVVWDAFEMVKANRGAAGVDGESIAEFEKDLRGKLYKLWNRMSSGTYFPPPGRGVVLTKKHRK